MPTFISATPLAVVSPELPRPVLEWDKAFNRAINKAIRGRLTVLASVSSHEHLFCLTYVCTDLLLPIDSTRQGIMDPLILWHWVYACRRIRALFLSPYNPHPWPKCYFMWVRPEGCVIPPRKNLLVEEARARLRTLMLRKDKGMMVIGWLVESPVLTIHPSFVHVSPLNIKCSFYCCL